MTTDAAGSIMTTDADARPIAARIRGRIVAREELSPGTRDAMFGLLATHFAGADRATFEADLAEKTWAILLEDGSGRLRGFSMLLVYDTTVDERSTIVYSGDTIVERRWWGSPALPRTWIQAVKALASARGRRDVYWFLLTSGFRTYRFLPVFFKSFHPRYDAGERPREAALLDAIARERFGAHYDAATGIVHLPAPQRLLPDLLVLPGGRTLDPHIAFFLQRNPGHARGDELACLARVHDDNLTPAGRRMTRAPRA